MENQKIILNTREGLFLIEPIEIVYIEALGSYSKVYLTEKRTIKVSKNTKHLKELLSNVDFFVDVHRSYFVNINFISKITSNGPNANSSLLHLTQYDPIPIVRIKIKPFLASINR